MGILSRIFENRRLRQDKDLQTICSNSFENSWLKILALTKPSISKQLLTLAFYCLQLRSCVFCITFILKVRSESHQSQPSFNTWLKGFWLRRCTVIWLFPKFIENQRQVRTRKGQGDRDKSPNKIFPRMQMLPCDTSSEPSLFERGVITPDRH